ncbi:MAG: hypothetical protein ACRC28_09355 [Clostridium sp.]|uniref:hypothetical protein n=1 Tax=Clostridium sp. TaxID=1506 RepID=UPI003F409259
MLSDEIREMYLKKEGREEGDLKRARIGIMNMLLNGMNKESISKMLEVEMKLVDEVAREVVEK